MHRVGDVDIAGIERRRALDHAGQLSCHLRHPVALPAGVAPHTDAVDRYRLAQRPRPDQEPGVGERAARRADHRVEPDAEDPGPAPLPPRRPGRNRARRPADAPGRNGSRTGGDPRRPAPGRAAPSAASAAASSSPTGNACSIAPSSRSSSRFPKRDRRAGPTSGFSGTALKAGARCPVHLSRVDRLRDGQRAHTWVSCGNGSRCRQRGWPGFWPGMFVFPFSRFSMA